MCLHLRQFDKAEQGVGMRFGGGQDRLDEMHGDAPHLVFCLFRVASSLAAETGRFIGVATFERHEGEAISGLVPLETDHPGQALSGPALVALHLLEDDYPAASWNVGRIGNSPLQSPITTFVERETGTTMGAFSKRTCYRGGRVYLDTSNLKRSSYFDGVPEEVWNFHVGGYHVLYKWLYDRRGTKGQPGRTLTPEDIEHYQRVVVALKEMMRLMGEIDKVINGHGGWPME
jgi:hypothetical protein